MLRCRCGPPFVVLHLLARALAVTDLFMTSFIIVLSLLSCFYLSRIFSSFAEFVFVSFSDSAMLIMLIP